MTERLRRLALSARRSLLEIGLFGSATSVARAAETVGPSTTTTSQEWDWPYTGNDWALVAGFALCVILVLWLYRRDTRTLPPLWRVWLMFLRLAAIAVLAVIALNPQERTERHAFRPSQVALLVDTSMSMQQPEVDPWVKRASPPRTRTEAVKELLAKSSLIAELRKKHLVDLYTFDNDLSQNQFRFEARLEPKDSAAGIGSEPPPVPSAEVPAERIPEWDKILQPRGASTRLGDAVDQLLVELRSKTLSGVVVFSDGAVNAGRDIHPANERARKDGVRLFAAATGSTNPPVNLSVSKIIAPTDVQKGDGYEIEALITAQGMNGRNVIVELLQQPPGSTESAMIDSHEAPILEDGTPISVRFERRSEEAGEFVYTIQVRPASGESQESRDDDNRLSRNVNVFDRPLKVLLAAGGPMRDYQFVRNVLRRHKAMEIHLYLQTGQVGIDDFDFAFYILAQLLLQ